jgi:hypothetical protein
VRRELILGAVVATVVCGAFVGLSRVFSEPGWLPPALAAMALALVVAAGARRVGFGALGSLIGSAVGLVVFTYVLHLPAGPLIPGAEQLADALALLDEGLEQLRREPAPTTPLPGLMLIVTTGVWVVTHVTHELVVRLRRPGLGLVPPTTLWAVPLAMPQDPGQTFRHTVPFLACAALLLLIESDVDVASWARDRHGPRLSAAGAAVGAFALAVAAIAPGLLPGYGAPSWVDIVGANDPAGYQPIVDVGDRLRLPEPRPALRVRSPRRVYLRLAALDTFDSNTWRIGPPGSASFSPDPEVVFPADEDLPPEVPIARADRVTVEVEVLDLENIYVPVPYQPVSIGGPSRDDMVYSLVGGFVATGQLAQNELAGRLETGVVPGFTYRVVADVPDPPVEDLRALEFDLDPTEQARWTQLPTGGADTDRFARYRELAESLYETAGAETVLDRTLALQDWFTGPDFRYSTTDIGDLRGLGALETFVFDTRVGYCEYFATAMAVMLRATGIPARVAVGFLPGERVAPGDPATGEPATFEVSTSDAHAWVEVLFPGYGWIKFDPTPRADAATMPPSDSELDPLDTLAEREAGQEVNRGEEEPTEAPTAPEQDAELPPGLENDGGPTTDAPGVDGGVPVLRLVLLGLLAVAAVGLVASRRRVRAHRPDLAGVPRVLAAQERLLLSARRLGLGRRASETTADVAARWASEGRVDPTAAARFAALAQRAAFGGDDVAAQDGERAEELVDRLVEQLRDSVPPAERLSAPVRIPLETATRAGRDAAARARELLADDRD